MTLTPEQVLQLTALFPAKDHEFIRGFTYLTEDSISDRLDEVDPNWTFEIVSVTQREKEITAHCRLTVGGVHRENTGMATIMPNAGEPEKSAVTDGLKRCARLFGIGRYILNIPKQVKDIESLDRWLNGISTPAPQPSIPAGELKDKLDAGKPEARRMGSEPAAVAETHEKVLLQNGWPTFYKLVDVLCNGDKGLRNQVMQVLNANGLDASKVSIQEAVNLFKQAVSERLPL